MRSVHVAFGIVAIDVHNKKIMSVTTTTTTVGLKDRLSSALVHATPTNAAAVGAIVTVGAYTYYIGSTAIYYLSASGVYITLPLIELYFVYYFVLNNINNIFSWVDYARRGASLLSTVFSNT